MRTAVVHVADWAAVARENNVDLASLLLANRIISAAPYAPPVIGQTVNLPDESQAPVAVAGGADHQIAAGPPALKSVKIALHDKDGNLLENARYVISYPGGGAQTAVDTTSNGVLTLNYLQTAAVGEHPVIVVQWGVDSIDEHMITLPILPPDVPADATAPRTPAGNTADPSDPYKGLAVVEMFISLARNRVGFATSIGMLLGDVTTDLSPNVYKVWSNPDKPGEWLVKGPGVTPGYRFDVDFTKIHVNYATLSYPKDEASAIPLTVAPGLAKMPDLGKDLFDQNGAYRDPLLVWENEPTPLPIAGDDDFEFVTYHMNYRTEHGGLSKILRAAYRDDSIREFNVDNVTSATPRLFAAKQAALSMMEDDFTLYTLQYVFPVVFQQIAQVPLASTPDVGVSGAVANQGPSYAPRALPRTVLDSRDEFSGLNWIRNTNPTFNRLNCSNCCAAVDSTLSGAPMQAAPRTIPATSDEVLNYFNTLPGATNKAQWLPMAGRPEIEAQMKAWGDGSQAIVAGTRGTNLGHVFFATYRGQAVYFLDGQTMDFATFDGGYSPVPGATNPFWLLRSPNIAYTGRLNPFFLPKGVSVTSPAAPVTTPAAVAPQPGSASQPTQQQQ
jgi:hypothetical protein